MRTAGAAAVDLVLTHIEPASRSPFILEEARETSQFRVHGVVAAE